MYKDRLIQATKYFNLDVIGAGTTHGIWSRITPYSEYVLPYMVIHSPNMVLNGTVFSKSFMMWIW